MEQWIKDANSDIKHQAQIEYDRLVLWMLPDLANRLQLEPEYVIDEFFKQLNRLYSSGK